MDGIHFLQSTACWYSMPRWAEYSYTRNISKFQTNPLLYNWHQNLLQSEIVYKIERKKSTEMSYTSISTNWDMFYQQLYLTSMTICFLIEVFRCNLQWLCCMHILWMAASHGGTVVTIVDNGFDSSVQLLLCAFVLIQPVQTLYI